LRGRRQHHGKASNRFDVAAQALRQTHDDVETPVALEQGARHLAAHRGCNRVLDVGHVDAVARGFLAVDVDGQHRQAARLLHVDLGRAVDRLQHLGHLLRRLVQHLHIVTKDLHGHVGPNARDELVEPQLNRLRELVVVARDIGQALLHCGQQRLVRTPGRRPVLLGLEHHVGVRDVGRHRV
jgi:hypothetical protein